MKYLHKLKTSNLSSVHESRYNPNGRNFVDYMKIMIKLLNSYSHLPIKPKMITLLTNTKKYFFTKLVYCMSHVP